MNAPTMNSHPRVYMPGERSLGRTWGEFKQAVAELPKVARYAGAVAGAAALAAAGVFGELAIAKPAQAADAKVTHVSNGNCTDPVIFENGAARATSQWNIYLGDPYWPHVNSPSDVNRELSYAEKGRDIQATAKLSNKEMKALRAAKTCVAKLRNGQTWQIGFSGHSVEKPVEVNYKKDRYGNPVNLNAYYKVAHVGNETIVMADPGCGNVLLNFFQTPPQVTTTHTVTTTPKPKHHPKQLTVEVVKYVKDVNGNVFPTPTDGTFHFDWQKKGINTTGPREMGKRDYTSTPLVLGKCTVGKEFVDVQELSPTGPEDWKNLTNPSQEQPCVDPNHDGIVEFVFGDKEKPVAPPPVTTVTTTVETTTTERTTTTTPPPKGPPPCDPNIAQC